MRSATYPLFSWKWVLISMGTFLGVELILGGVVGTVVLGRYMSLSLGFILQGLLHLISFFAGGVIVGLISPGIRIQEPATGAALTVALMLGLTLFTPYSFIRFSLMKLVLGGAVAFFLAMTGAKLGERLTGRRR